MVPNPRGGGPVIGIGCGSDPAKIERSIKASGENCVVYRDPKELVADLVSGKIDAAVRGDMSATKVLPVLKKALGLDKLERCVMLQPAGGKLFFMVPVGVDEGWTVDEKYDLATKTVALMKDMGMDARIAVLSGGRNEDAGRHPSVDRSLEDAKLLTNRLVSAGYRAYDAQILLEMAALEANLLVVPDGTVGNLIFRALHFLGGAAAIGAPVVNADVVFVDTSRVKEDYSDSIELAVRLAEGR
ncbi:MAG: methanogenesis marker protein Mmp4/MtxX [Thermoplasmatales archaeon]|nr:methanogenesis marker protein Mmp4/MtxX [Thermoplasmatales archaeon]